MKDPRERFTETAADYDRWRPGYPPELLDWLVGTCGLAAGARAADVGCGTGISTRLLAARGFDVVGIDPNEAMLEKARARGGARYLRGEAARTGLPDAAFDLVAAAQAFHWFDVSSTLAEWRRILKPGGWAAAFWNERTKDTPFLRGYEALLRELSAEYPEVAGGGAALAALRGAPGVRDWREARFPSSQSLDREGLLGRARSSSYVAHGVADRAAFERRLDELFRRHAEDGRVEFRYEAVAACWRLW